MQTDHIYVMSEKRYVAAMMSDIPMFIARDIKSGTVTRGENPMTFMLTDNIAIALKSPQKSTIRDVINEYNLDNAIKIDFVVLPIEVTYEIIDEPEEIL